MKVEVDINAEELVAEYVADSFGITGNNNNSSIAYLSLPVFIPSSKSSPLDVELHWELDELEKFGVKQGRIPSVSLNIRDEYFEYFNDSPEDYINEMRRLSLHLKEFMSEVDALYEKTLKDMINEIKE